MKQITLLVFLLIVGVTLCTAKYAPVVMTDSGPVRGIIKETLIEKRSYSSYISVPYGKASRFGLPQKPDPWRNVLDTIEISSICMQYDFLIDTVVGSEDCLTVHVYTPKVTNASSDLLPVMVWFHGGAYQIGSPNTTLYGPDLLLEENVVVVAVNYRLSVLGFLAINHPAASGNAGLEDQRLALKWIQNNIAEFGGDPKKVTLFGQSAGASSVDFHVLSKRSKGLFHGTISQSGAALCQWAIVKPHKAYDNAFKLGKILGYRGTNTEGLLQFLKSVDARKIIAAAWEHSTLDFLPTVQPPSIIREDQAFLSKCPYEQLKNGDYNKVPRIMGYIKNEGITIVTIVAKGVNISAIGSPEFASVFGLLNPKTIKEITSRMSDKELVAVSKVVTNAGFVGAIDLQQKYMATNNDHEIFYYRYSLDSPYAWHKMFYNFSGPGHVDEIPLIFRTKPVYTPTDINTVEGRIRRMMVRMWTNFAKYGNPTPKSKRDALVNFEWMDSRPNGTMIDIDEVIRITDRLPSTEDSIVKVEEIIEKTAPNYGGC